MTHLLRTAAFRDHRGQDSLGDEEGAGEVQSNYSIPMFTIKIENLCTPHERSGVVNQDVRHSTAIFSIRPAARFRRARSNPPRECSLTRLPGSGAQRTALHRDCVIMNENISATPARTMPFQPQFRCSSSNKSSHSAMAAHSQFAYKC